MCIRDSHNTPWYLFSLGSVKILMGVYTSPHGGGWIILWYICPMSLSWYQLSLCIAAWEHVACWLVISLVDQRRFCVSKFKTNSIDLKLIGFAFFAIFRGPVVCGAFYTNSVHYAYKTFGWFPERTAPTFFKLCHVALSPSKASLSKFCLLYTSPSPRD